MKRIARLLIYSLAILCFSLLMSSCQNKDKEASTANSTHSTYTCPMHPQVVKDVPGSCPICGMDLIAVTKTAGISLTLSDRQQALANVTTAVIGENELSGFKQLNARLAIDPSKSTVVSSRVAGRIEQLFVREPGVKVAKGQPLYKVYSEELATLQKEYLLAVAQVKAFPSDAIFMRVLTGARQKLELYGLQPAQIAAFEKRATPDPFITYYAPQSGTVAEVSVTQGQYVSEGSAILRMESYGNLWVEADVYPSEASLVKSGMQVKVIVAGWEDQPQMVTINFIAPAFQANGQLLQLRGEISNPNNQWQPGLQASVFLPTSAQTAKTLSLPVDAVLRTGDMPHVWIKTGEGIFEPRMVTLGKEGLDLVEIKSGLAKGDEVVITGAYLLYSESILKKGIVPMAGMKM